MTIQFFLELVAQASNFAGAVGGIVAAFGVIRLLMQEAKKKERVEVALRLEGEGREIALPLELHRRDVSRAELLGRLGMLPMRQKGKRFSLRALSTPAFMAAVNDVVEAKSLTLVIPASKEELAQFDI